MSPRSAGLGALLTLVLVGGSPARAQTDYADASLNIILNVEGDCDAKRPHYEKLAQQALADGAREWAAAALSTVASCHGEKGRVAEAMKALERAVELGYSDCWTLRNDPGLKTLSKHPPYAALRARLKMAPIDYAEMTWLQTEAQTIAHDTSMMISENMGRKDRAPTPIAASSLPKRRSADAAIRIVRALVAGLQGWQRAMVGASDQSRMSHLMNMTVIGNMGSGGGGPSPDEQQRSLLTAQSAFDARQAAVSGRVFRAPTGAGSKPVGCDAL